MSTRSREQKLVLSPHRHYCEGGSKTRINIPVASMELGVTSHDLKPLPRRSRNEAGSAGFLTGEDGSPTEGACGVLVVEPLFQADLVEEMAAREPVHHRVRLEPGEADAAVGGLLPPPPEGGAEPNRPAPAAEPLRQAVRLLRLISRCVIRRRRRRRAEAEELAEGAEELLQDGDGEGSVDEYESEHALRWVGEARKPHGRPTGKFDTGSFRIAGLGTYPSCTWRQI